MANTTVAFTNINLLKESQIPASPNQNELYAVELEGKPATETQLNQKLDLDVGNATSNTKKTIVGWGMPDYNAGISVPSLPYTAINNGYIYITQQNDSYITVNGSNVAYNEQTVAASNSQKIGFFIPVSKNDVITSTNTSKSTGIVFYPMKGVSNA